MIRVTVVPKERTDIYSLLAGKESELRRQGKGTLHKKGKKRGGAVRWVHSTYPGWIRMQRTIGQMVVAVIDSKTEKETQLLSAFVGFLDRHFRSEISSINISYEATE